MVHDLPALLPETNHTPHTPGKGCLVVSTARLALRTAIDNQADYEMTRAIVNPLCWTAVDVAIIVAAAIIGILPAGGGMRLACHLRASAQRFNVARRDAIGCCPAC